MAGPGKRWRTDELADDGPFVMMWDYWITGMLAMLPLNRREVRPARPGGVNLYQSYGESSCMNATVTVALEQARALNPSTAGENNLVACA